jgi:hypothetical protein
MTLTRIYWKFALGLALTAAAIFPAGAAAQAPAPANDGGAPVRMTVTATSKEKDQQPPALTPQDFLIYEGKDRRPILKVVPQQGADNKLDLYIVVDDSIDSGVTLNYPDVGKFVRELPTPARVGVIYTTNGTIQVARDLNDDREAALKALRIPIGRIGVAGGIYLSLADLAKRLPAIPGRRYALLFLSSGIDTFRGIRDTNPGLNPDLDLAIDRLNRAGITVFSIYVSPAAHFVQSFFLVSNGQSSLSRLAQETGGEAYFQGFNSPVSMTPFLEEMQRHLANQYLVTFAAKSRKKSAFIGVKVRTELSGVDLESPERVYVNVPGTK